MIVEVELRATNEQPETREVAAFFEERALHGELLPFQVEATTIKTREIPLGEFSPFLEDSLQKWK